jgi:TonB family protein
MLHPFVSSPTARPRRNYAPVLALSAFVHVGLIYAALTSTGAERPPYLPETTAEHVHYAALPYRAGSLARRSSGRESGRVRRGHRASARPEFTLPVLPASFDLVLPEAAPLPDYRPDYQADYAAFEISGSTGLADDVLHLGVGPATSRGTAGGLSDAYEEVAVEKRAEPVTANAKPRYPSQMLSRGIESNFHVYFVVDSSGTVDEKTVEWPRSVQEEFTRAVAEVLFRWRFVPAELGGRRVRQRVEQPFIFQMLGR